MGGTRASRIARDANRVKPQGHALIAAGSAYALGDLVAAIDHLEPQVRCEDPQTDDDQLIHKRLFVFVPAQRLPEAVAAIGGTDGPPFVRGLCSTHPAWTRPCPDCASAWDWMGDDVLNQQIAENKVARRWVRDQIARRRFGTRR